MNAPVQRHSQRAQQLIYLLRKRSGRLLVVFLFLTLVFVLAAVVQGWFVRTQLDRTTKQELATWAAVVAKEVAYTDKWDLSGYRNASIFAPNWHIISKDGLIVDVEGFLPGLFGKVEPPPQTIFERPETITTSIGESWRLFGRKFSDGYVEVGSLSSENTNNADALLRASADRFGSTLKEALAVSSRQIDITVDYAVVSFDGEMENVWGGVPLKTAPPQFPTTGDRLTTLMSGEATYWVLQHPILDLHGNPVGEVLIQQDMGLELAAVSAQRRFNVSIIGALGLLTTYAALWLVVSEIRQQSKRVTLAMALQVGESSTVEFKTSFHWDVWHKRQNDEIRLIVLKSIAGFLNAKGGTLFIGVTENKGNKTNPYSVCGLEEDLKLANDSKDQLQLTLRHLITSRIGPEFSPLITDSLEEEGGKLYWVVVVEESRKPAFVRWKSATDQSKFYVREGPKTSGLDNESTWNYIKNKWG
jgi:hypothetical protein